MRKAKRYKERGGGGDGNHLIDKRKREEPKEIREQEKRNKEKLSV